MGDTLHNGDAENSAEEVFKRLAGIREGDEVRIRTEDRDVRALSMADATVNTYDACDGERLVTASLVVDVGDNAESGHATLAWWPDSEDRPSFNLTKKPGEERVEELEVVTDE